MARACRTPMTLRLQAFNDIYFIFSLSDKNQGNVSEQLIQNKVKSNYNTASCIFVVCSFDITDPKEGSVKESLSIS